MSVQNRNVTLAPDGATRRPEGASNATGEEERADPSRLSRNDVAAAADNPERERVSTNLRITKRIGTWNVQGMTAGKLKIVTRRMQECKISVLGIAETWRLNQANFRTDDGFTVVYSGKDTGKRERGVGVIMGQEAAKALMGFNPINDRIISVRLRGHPFNITILQAYAPTGTAPDEDIDMFYEQLDDALEKIPARDMLVVMGDWNAKIGQTNAKSAVTGRFGLGERNERGDKLEEFCLAHNLVIGNTLFQQHPRRLWTWLSPGDRVRNQIDYIMVRNRWRSSLLSVKTRPGADCGSDHQLLVAAIRLRLKASKSGSRPIRFDVESVSEQFKVQVKNKFELLMRAADEEKTPNELWEEMKEVVFTTAKGNIPRRKRRKQPWISNRTLELADKRQTAKIRGDRTEWQHLNREVTTSVKADQKAFIEKKCEEIEKSGGNSKKIFGVVRELTRKCCSSPGIINDKHGKTLVESSEITGRWAEYCSELYEQKTQGIPSSDSSKFRAGNEPPPLKSEVRRAVKQLKKGKAPGIDNIPSELWQATGEEGTELLWRLCVKIWNQEEWPKDWCRAVFIPLPKKGDLKECANHRTISLISHASKVLLKIINARMEKKMELEIPEEQAGFRRGRGTRDQIVNIRNIIEKCRSHRTPLYLCFIDYAKAFDCVSHEMLWDAMRNMGFPAHVVDLIGRLYKDQESAVRTSRGDSRWFSIGRGVRQGCILSPNLFNIYAEAIMREALEDFEGGIKIGGRRITNMRYADDTTLLCNNREDLLKLLKSVKDASERRGLLLNTKKTKIMVIDPSRDDVGEAYKVDGQDLEKVTHFEYLGSMINTRGDCSQEIRRRLAMGKKAVIDMAKIWKSSIPTALKARLLRATAFAVATYGAESWAMKKNERKRVDAFEMWCYRRLLRVSWRERKTNAWVLEKIGSAMTLRSSIAQRKLRYFGHIIRHTSLERDIIQGQTEGLRGRGRPPTSWMDDIRALTGGTVVQATRLACNRAAWRALISATPARVRAL